MHPLLAGSPVARLQRLGLLCVLLLALTACSPPPVQTAPRDLRMVMAPAGRIAMVQRGSGEPTLLFLHDLGSNMSIWEGLVARLPHWSGSIMLLDLRGHGASEAAGDGDYRVSSVALDVVSIVERQEFSSVILVGHGWGGQVALKVAAALGRKVKGVFLLDPTPEASLLSVEHQRAVLEGFMAVKESREFIQGLIQPETDGLKPEEVARVMESAQAVGRGVITAVYQGIWNNRAMEDLAGYRGGVLAVVSDANTGPLSLQNLTEDLPYRVIVGKGHYLMLTATDEVARILEEWLEVVR